MNRILAFFFLFLIIVFATGDILARGNDVAVRFEVDGKPVSQKFKVELESNGQIIEAQRSRNGFYLPSRLEKCGSCEIFAVRCTSKKYVLAFDGVFEKDLDSDWVPDIDNAPFDQDHLDILFANKNTGKIHYLNFRPKDDEIATGLTVVSPRKDLKTN